MASVNKVLLIGNLGKDPEQKFSKNGDSITNITVATTEKWKDKNTGENKEQTEWNNVVLYRRLGEIAAEYLKKGSMVWIEGRLETQKWTDKQGVERYTTRVIANDMKMLSGKPSVSGQTQTKFDSKGGSYKKPPTQEGFDDIDDIPFDYAPGIKYFPFGATINRRAG